MLERSAFSFERLFVVSRPGGFTCSGRWYASGAALDWRALGFSDVEIWNLWVLGDVDTVEESALPPADDIVPARSNGPAAESVGAAQPAISPAPTASLDAVAAPLATDEPAPLAADAAAPARSSEPVTEVVGAVQPATSLAVSLAAVATRRATNEPAPPAVAAAPPPPVAVKPVASPPPPAAMPGKGVLRPLHQNQLRRR